MTIQHAITKAVEGGYDTSRALYHDWQDPKRGQHSMEKMYLDPFFWQALGKSMGWCLNDVCYANLGHIPLGYLSEEEIDWGGCDICTKGSVYKSESWRYHWHRLIDSLSEGKSIEQFFEQLN
jgi:hypothetical protein